MRGEGFVSFLPFDESALQWSTSLQPWIKSWVNTNDLEFLTPKDWFVRGHDVIAFNKPLQDGHLPCPIIKKKTFVWSPPLAAANVAVKVLKC